MSLSVPQFLQALAESGLMSVADIESLKERTSDSGQSADDLAQQLVETQRLTQFQSQTLLNGDGPSAPMFAKLGPSPRFHSLQTPTRPFSHIMYKPITTPHFHKTAEHE